MFDILIADPPWQYNNKRTGGSLKSGAEQHYPTMDLSTLMDLSGHLDRLMSENSMIFLWTTNSFIREAFSLLCAYDYTYKTMITWVKKNYGLGAWFRGKTEHCLFGIKGDVPALRMNLPNLIISEEKLEHSQKPQEFYNYVSRCAYKMRDNSKDSRPFKILELFARDQICMMDLNVQWTCLGNELTGNDIWTDLYNVTKL